MLEVGGEGAGQSRLQKVAVKFADDLKKAWKKIKNKK